MYVFTFVCIYACVCMYIHMYIYTCIYILSVDGLSPVYETKQLIDQLIATECQKSRFNRGPFLAQLELLLQLNQNDIKIQEDGCMLIIG